MAATVIGRVLATEKHPTTIDDFTFWTDPELILNPFDIVKVQHVNNSFSYGVIEDIAHITDAASFLTNFISSDFGDVMAEENTLRVGMNYVTAKVVCNTENIYIPLQSNAKVMLATAEEINYALGLNDIRNPLVCGYLEMYEGTKNCEKVTLPVNLNSKFIIGPEGAHLNISGISGLASKTSYAMFLLKAIQDSYMKKDPKNEDEDSVAFVLFNVKGKDLLAIDQINDFSDERNPEQARKETFAKYEKLGLAAEPFKNVQYYYPYSIPKTRHWNTYMTPEEVADNIKKKKAKKFKYIYKYDKENLDLMFANIDDSTQTMESIISYIMSGQGKFNQVSDFGKFLDPLADKLLTIAAMTMFCQWARMPAWALMIVLTREFAVTGLRLVAVGKGTVIAAGWSGKIKTASTMIGLCVMMAFPTVVVLNWIVIAVIVVTTVYSGVEYFVQNWKCLWK